MELNFLNANFGIVGIIDAFESLIWTERYFECGDFELLTTPSLSNIYIISQSVYVTLRESERFMIVEDAYIKTDPVEGNKLTIKGRSGEILLDRRIVWESIKFQEESIQSAIFALLNENILNPSDNARKIVNLEFEVSTDPYILGIRTSNQYWGGSLYDAIVDLCVSNLIGFKITLTDQGKYRFKLYAGIDRSYDQVDNPYVIFSPDFENLKNSTYIKTDKLFKTTCLVAGEKGVSNTQMSVEVSSSYETDIGRREMFLDAQNVSRTDANGNQINDEEYIQHLCQRGNEELSKNVIIRSFSSEVDPVSNFTYEQDFFLGDILQTSNEYGYEDKSRVIEITRCQDLSGFRVFPVFTAVRSSYNIDENVNLRKVLTVSPPKEISVGINLAKRLDIPIGFYEYVNLDKILDISIIPQFNP